MNINDYHIYSFPFINFFIAIFSFFFFFFIFYYKKIKRREREQAERIEEEEEKSFSCRYEKNHFNSDFLPFSFSFYRNAIMRAHAAEEKVQKSGRT